MTNVVVYHGVDNDGWASAWVLKKYLTEKYPDTNPIFFYPWNYGWDTDKLEEYLERNKNNELTIYMADITLPDEFMNKWAPYIWWLDHHSSQIDMRHTWVDKLQKCFSCITRQGYLDNNNKQAEQIASCELVWITLFPNKQMPKFIRLAGRYDVWDLTPEIKALNFFVHNKDISDSKRSMYRFLEDWYDKLQDNNFLNECIEKGKVGMEWKRLMDAANAAKNVTVSNVMGSKMAVANGSYYSDYFDSITQKDPTIDGIMSFRYGITHDMWSVSVYTIKETFNALQFIKQYENILPEIISIGGHDRACGMEFSGKYITHYLETIKKWEDSAQESFDKNVNDIIKKFSKNDTNIETGNEGILTALLLSPIVLFIAGILGMMWKEKNTKKIAEKIKPLLEKLGPKIDNTCNAYLNYCKSTTPNIVKIINKYKQNYPVIDQIEFPKSAPSKDEIVKMLIRKIAEIIKNPKLLDNKNFGSSLKLKTVFDDEVHISFKEIDTDDDKLLNKEYDKCTKIFEKMFNETSKIVNNKQYMSTYNKNADGPYWTIGVDIITEITKDELKKLINDLNATKNKLK